MTRRKPGVHGAFASWRCVLLIAAADFMLELIEEELEPIGLTWRTFRILTLVGKLGSVPQSVVAERIGLDRTTMSKAAHELQRLQLVLLLPPAPGRRSELVLTDHGEQVLAHGEYAVSQAEKRLLGRLGVTHGRRSEEYLRRLAPRWNPWRDTRARRPARPA
jgi:DNA-binding MarR family transcriptional regulator